jgi:hypothetical protein
LMQVRTVQPKHHLVWPMVTIATFGLLISLVVG